MSTVWSCHSWDQVDIRNQGAQSSKSPRQSFLLYLWFIAQVLTKEIFDGKMQFTVEPLITSLWFSSPHFIFVMACRRQSTACRRKVITRLNVAWKMTRQHLCASAGALRYYLQVNNSIWLSCTTCLMICKLNYCFLNKLDYSARLFSSLGSVLRAGYEASYIIFTLSQEIHTLVLVIIVVYYYYC